MAALVCVALTASVLSTLASFISIDAIHHHTTETTVQSTATWLREAAASTSVALRNTTAAILGRDNCTDSDSNCPQWAVQGECTANPTFMVSNCRMSCGQCGAVQARWAQRGACADRSSFCGQWAAVGECDSNPNYMRANCPVTCHLCQSGDCHDSDQVRCAARAAAGECRRAPEVMYGECRWSCKWCAMRENARCKRPPGTRPAAVGGTVNHVFSRAALMERYLPRVLSRDPWVIVFEDFLSQGEAERIIRVGGARGWGRSQAGDGVQAVRTSSTAWCDPGSCQSDAVLASIRSRIANVTLVPEQNAEHMQVLRYEVGQFYKTHHDQNAPLTAAWGPRMYTFFMCAPPPPHATPLSRPPAAGPGPDEPRRPCSAQWLVPDGA